MKTPRFLAWLAALAVALPGTTLCARAQETAPAPETAAAPTGAVERVELAAPDSMGAELKGDLISLSLNDVEMADVINMFIRISGANIIATPSNLTGRVTVSLKDVSWRDALAAILEMQRLQLVRAGPDADVYSIVAKPEGEAEPLFIESFSLKCRRPEQLQDGLKLLLLPKGQVLTASGNMVSVLGTARQVESVQKMIEKVDQPVPQVVIEAKFVELNDQAIKDLGINWRVLQGYTIGLDQLRWNVSNQRTASDSTLSNVKTYENIRNSDVRTRSSTSGQNNTDQTKQFFDMGGTQYEETTTTYEENPPGSGNYTPVVTRTPTREFSGLATALAEDKRVRENSRITGSDRDLTRTRSETRTYTDLQTAILSADAFSLTLSALKQNGGADVISNPKIVVASGETALIHVGRKDPEVKAVADNNLAGRLTYERSAWVESGVRLEVKPVVNTERVISAVIKPQLSRVIGFQESGDTKVKIPILSTREISSQFVLPSGQTVAIGGLTETQDKDQTVKVPFLGDIPILGRLFTHTHTERVQDEVIVFVTMAVTNPETMDATTGVPTQQHLYDRRLESLPGGRLNFLPRDPKERKQLEDARRKAAEASAPAAPAPAAPAPAAPAAPSAPAPAAP